MNFEKQTSASCYFSCTASGMLRRPTEYHVMDFYCFNKVDLSHFRLILDKNNRHNTWRLMYVVNSISAKHARKYQSKNCDGSSSYDKRKITSLPDEECTEYWYIMLRAQKLLISEPPHASFVLIIQYENLWLKIAWRTFILTAYMLTVIQIGVFY